MCCAALGCQDEVLPRGAWLLLPGGAPAALPPRQVLQIRDVQLLVRGRLWGGRDCVGGCTFFYISTLLLYWCQNQQSPIIAFKKLNNFPDRYKPIPWCMLSGAAAVQLHAELPRAGLQGAASVLPRAAAPLHEQHHEVHRQVQQGGQHWLVSPVSS